MSITTVLDRMHSINGTISGVKAKRYFPEGLDSAKLPCLVPLFGRVISVAASSKTWAHVTREYTQYLIVEAWMAGLPTESASADAETLTDAINAAYFARPRLELDGSTPLATVKEITVQPDSGLAALAEGIPVAIVRFPIYVTTVETVTLEMTTA